MIRNNSKARGAVIVAVSLVVVILLCRLTLVLIERNSARHNHYETMSGWTPITGRWSTASGVITNANYGRGDMVIASHSDNSNYRISADIRFDLLFADTHRGDAGLVIRTTDPEPGVDSYQGYYAGLRPDDQTVILGRASFDWHELRVASLASPLTVGSWYHLEISANDCNLSVDAAPLGGGAHTKLNFHDDHCLGTGVAGLRSFYAGASWRNVKITRN